MPKLAMRTGLLRFLQHFSLLYFHAKTTFRNPKEQGDEIWACDPIEMGPWLSSTANIYVKYCVKIRPLILVTSKKGVIFF